MMHLTSLADVILRSLVSSSRIARRSPALTALVLMLALVMLRPCLLGAASVTDDFSSPATDTTKWQDFADTNRILRLQGGMLESGIKGLGQAFRNSSLAFANPASITSVTVNLTVTEAVPVGSGNARARLRLFFYNDGTPGPGQIGDILAQPQLRVTTATPPGMAEVAIQVARCDDATCDAQTSLLFDTGTFGFVPVGISHTLGVAWDGAQTFTFTMNGTPLVFDTGIPFAAPAKNPFKALETQILLFPVVVPTDGGSLRALYDNVIVNGSAYDDFSGDLIDPGRWVNPQQFVKQNVGGVFESVLQRFGSAGSNNLVLLQPELAAFMAADVTITAVRNSGARPQGRLFGQYFNTAPGGGQPGDQTGDIQAGVLIFDHENGSGLRGSFFVVRCLDSPCASIEFLVADDTTFGPVGLGTTHRLSLGFDGTTFTFGLDEQRARFTPALPSTGPARAPVRVIGSRIGNPIGALVDELSEGGFVHATFDNFVASALAPVVVASGDAASGAPRVSADGRYVVFASEATNLIAGGSPPGVRQVYRVDRQTGEVIRVSQTPGGTPGDGPSGDPVVSADGRHVAYPTLAQNLTICANGIQQIARTDVVTGETDCVSRGTPGPASAASSQPTISGDGNLVAFVTPADLDSCAPGGVDQVYLRDVAAGTTRCASVDAGGQAGTGPSTEPVLSGDGTTLVFATRATNLILGSGALAATRDARPSPGGDPLGQREPLAQVMRRSTAVGAAVAQLMSQGPGGSLGNGESRRPAVSDDGQTVAFDSSATNLVSGCASGERQVLVAGPGGMRCVSRNETGAPGDGANTQPALSGTGAVVVWVSLARNLTRGVNGPAGVSQILRNNPAVQNAVVELLSQSGGVPGNGTTQRPSIDRRGEVTVFQTSATNLVSGDVNGQDDVLAVVIPLAPPAVLDRVTITAPASGTVLPLAVPTPLTVMWTPLDGADQYGVEFTGPDRVFANPNGTAADGVNGFGGAGGAVVVSGTSFPVTLDPSFPAGLYQLRVAGLTAAFQLVGRFSDAITLGLGAVPPGNGRVRISQPASGSVLVAGTPVTFVWTALPAVASYFFEFTGPGGQFANPNGTGPDLTNAAGGGLVIATTGFTTTVPALAPGVYQVRVIGRTAAGAFVGTFSDAVALTIQ
jgi:Tol biopolymer transport system component